MSDPHPAQAGLPAAIRVAGVRTTFGSVVAVDGVDLEVGRGEIQALLGPSGCGKTTLLRTIAGLERAEAGTIEIGDRLVTGPGMAVEPERRRVGMVFQDLALFPHLTVAQNVAYGIDRTPDRATRVRELLALVGLPDAGRLRPHELSGGMQQRVALARALAPRPEVVLLDEPFASLDQALRVQLRDEVRTILRASGASALFVTHDQTEALTLADRVAVMRGGRIEQVATPEIIYNEPATPFVATFVGVANLVPGEGRGDEVRTALGSLRVDPGTPPGPVLAVIRPEHLDLDPVAHAGTADGVRGHVVARRFAGSELLFRVMLDGRTVSVWVEAGPHAREIALDDAVRLRLRQTRSVAFPAGALGRRGDASRRVLDWAAMSDLPHQPRPAEFKTRLDGQGGLVRVPLAGGLHDGRELFIDEMELPAEIYVTPRDAPFEWWPAALSEVMAGTSVGGDPDAPPIRYVLDVGDDTREPRFVAQPAEG